MRSDLNIVSEVHAGVFGATMWCPFSSLLQEIIDPELTFVLVSGHQIGQGVWESFSLPIISPTDHESVLARSALFDFIISTKRFLELLPHVGSAITAVQLRRMPPEYLYLDRIKGTERFRVLNECGWHVLLETPAIDYGRVFSPNRDVVEKAVRLHLASKEQKT